MPPSQTEIISGTLPHRDQKREREKKIRRLDVQQVYLMGQCSGWGVGHPWPPG